MQVGVLPKASPSCYTARATRPTFSAEGYNDRIACASAAVWRARHRHQALYRQAKEIAGRAKPTCQVGQWPLCTPLVLEHLVGLHGFFKLRRDQKRTQLWRSPNKRGWQ